MKAIKYIALGIGVFFGGRYLLSLSRASNKAIVSVSGKRGLISAQGINVTLNYNIKNPSRANLKITPPLVKLLINDKLVASSTMQNVEIPDSIKDSKGRISINAFSETGNIITSILVPWLSIVTISPDILSRLQSGDSTQKVQVSIETLSHAFTSIGDFPLDDKTTIQL
ncbi:MAG: hypothetical protein N4A35_17690 [Flavobacteriales bacterium]|jgi:hypothetical protein|nr:hypothetical protein [Flavobacteriales bacterium]